MNPDGPAKVTVARRYLSSAALSERAAEACAALEAEVPPDARCKGVYLGKQLVPLTDTELEGLHLEPEEPGIKIMVFFDRTQVRAAASLGTMLLTSFH